MDTDSTDLIARYARREQALLEHLRQAQVAATVGNLSGVLQAHTHVYDVLVSILGEQTQEVLRQRYS
jgi:5-methylcytosine-specific restriction endonuclease McrBC regulatory subunit McrC